MTTASPETVKPSTTQRQQQVCALVNTMYVSDDNFVTDVICEESVRQVRELYEGGVRTFAKLSGDKQRLNRAYTAYLKRCLDRLEYGLALKAAYDESADNEKLQRGLRIMRQMEDHVFKALHDMFMLYMGIYVYTTALMRIEDVQAYCTLMATRRVNRVRERCVQDCLQFIDDRVRADKVVSTAV